MSTITRQNPYEIEAFPIKKLSLKLDYDHDTAEIITTITLRAVLDAFTIAQINHMFELGAPLYAIIGSDQAKMPLDAEQEQPELEPVVGIAAVLDAGNRPAPIKGMGTITIIEKAD